MTADPAVNPVKMRRVVESELFGYLRDREFSRQKKLVRAFYAHTVAVLGWRVSARAFLEAAPETRLGETAFAGDSRNVEFVSGVAADLTHRVSDRFVGLTESV